MGFGVDVVDEVYVDGRPVSSGGRSPRHSYGAPWPAEIWRPPLASWVDPTRSRRPWCVGRRGAGTWATVPSTSRSPIGGNSSHPTGCMRWQWNGRMAARVA
jgi:hypothetical protein